MKTKYLYKLILLGIFMCLSQGLMAQTFIQDREVDQQILEASLNGLGFNITKLNFAVIENNNLFLKQIGDFNSAEINTITENSEIEITQNGNYNSTNLDYLADTAIAKLLQDGNNNQIRDYVNDANANISLELEQKGNDKIFERNGVNVLTQSLKFTQTDATPSIIIRSYN